MNRRAEELYMSSRYFDLAYPFTICEHGDKEKNFYNFSVHVSKSWAREFYFGHLDLLEQFVNYYKYSIQLNNKLNRAYQMPFLLDKSEGTYLLNSGCEQFVSATSIKEFKNSVQPKAANTQLLESLPRRELQCALLLLEGRTAKEVAETLNISARTVESYLIRLKERFEAKNIVQLTRALIEAGVLQYHQTAFWKPSL